LSKRYKINYDSELSEAKKELEILNQTKAESVTDIAKLNTKIEKIRQM